MNKILTPSVETTKDFILIKIPRNFVSGQVLSKKILALERGLKESIKEVIAGKLLGPFPDSKSFLRALKNSGR